MSTGIDGESNAEWSRYEVTVKGGEIVSVRRLRERDEERDLIDQIRNHCKVALKKFDSIKDTTSPESDEYSAYLERSHFAGEVLEMIGLDGAGGFLNDE